MQRYRRGGGNVLRRKSPSWTCPTGGGPSTCGRVPGTGCSTRANRPTTAGSSCPFYIRLDGLILTQPDGNHLAAAPLVLADLAPGKLFDSAAGGRGSSYQRDFASLAAEKHLSVTHWQRGDSLALPEKAEVRVFYPPAEGPAGRTAGDKGLVLQLRVAGWRIMFLGDSGVATARALARDNPAEVLRNDVVVSGHGPASREAVPELWGTLSPRLIVLKSGRAQREEPGPTVLSASSGGAVTLRFYPDRIEARSFVDDRTYQLRR